jgi:ssDNA-binding Zn-finger/Zn-ribbon topoisomerase 1
MSSPATAQLPTSHSLNCPDCGNKMELRRSKFSNGYWYACAFYPQCKGSHGPHPDGRPLGKPADRETKQLRIKAHDLLDPIYECYPKGKPQRRARWRAYMWVAFAMGLSMQRAHIGEFNAEQCRRLITLIETESYVIAPYEDEMPLSQSDKKAFKKAKI